MTDSEAKELIKWRINSLLNTKFKTMRSLSRKAGFSDGYMNQIMNNNMMPSISAILSLCDASDMTLSEFFDDSAVYPLEYYKVTKELQKMSAKRLDALYTLLTEENNQN
jgi:transcriptional regulator with XRE-family HTH domain